MNTLMQYTLKVRDLYLNEQLRTAMHPNCILQL